ncbi:MAG: hypothetical protein MUE81_20895 [Thermoflexibacter sp.]|jgi:hypothetical protein|nr:hypothetical protein [Thermoflexibacter sp.]
MIEKYGDIALGKSHAGLKRFGAFVKANIFTEWQEIFLVYRENISFQSKFFRILDETVSRKHKIKFIITDVDIDFSRGENVECEEPSITEWELSIVLRDKEFYNHTIFYRKLEGDVFIELSTQEKEELNLVLITKE